MWQRPYLDVSLVSSTVRGRSSFLLVLLSLAAVGCSSAPPHPSHAAAVPVRARLEAPIAGPTCVRCADQTREIQRLRMELASQDAELRELRSRQRDQVKVLQQSRREVTRAKVKLRRLATRADAASYIGEVEVAMASLRASDASGSIAPQIVEAQRLLQSTDAPFAQGDYGAAMDRAAEAEQLIIAASDARTQRPTWAHGKTKSHPPVTLSSMAKNHGKPRERQSPVVRSVGTQQRNRPSLAGDQGRNWLEARNESR